MVIKTESGYKAQVYCDGLVILCELVNGEWKDCVFQTAEDAQKAIEEYNEFWKQ